MKRTTADQTVIVRAINMTVHTVSNPCGPFSENISRYSADPTGGPVVDRLMAGFVLKDRC